MTAIHFFSHSRRLPLSPCSYVLFRAVLRPFVFTALEIFAEALEYYTVSAQGIFARASNCLKCDRAAISPAMLIYKRISFARCRSFALLRLGFRFCIISTWVRVFCGNPEWLAGIVCECGSCWYIFFGSLLIPFYASVCSIDPIPPAGFCVLSW